MKKLIKPKRKSLKHIRQLSKLKRKFLEYYAKLPIQKLAADFINKDETTISRWKERDINFANQIASAKSAWALEKSKRIRSNEWLLERVMKDHFAEKKEVDIGAAKSVDEMFERFSKMLPD